MATTSKSTKTNEVTEIATDPEKIERETISQAFAQFETVKILMMVGQPYGGKTQIAQAIFDIANLADRDDVFAGDCEEGGNKAFARCSPEKIQSMKIEDVSDIDLHIEDLEKDNHRFSLLDLKGSSQHPVKNAFGDFQHLTRMSVTVVPIIVVGTRDGAEKVAKEWVEIFKYLPKIYWLWNNQDFGSDDKRKLPKDLENVSSKIVEIRIPPIRKETAEEIIRIGAPLSKVVTRTVEGSPHLSRRYAVIEIQE